MAVNSEKNYYINPKALSFTPNYQGYRNIVYVSIVSNAAIKAYHNDIDGLGYGMDAEYQTWRLSGTTTALGTASAYFIYARLSRTQHVADIIFSVRDYNVEGGYSYTDSEGNSQTVEKSDEYFYIKIGSLTATDAAGDDATVNRVLTYVSGELGTDKQINEKSDSVFEQMFEFVSSGVEKLINVKQPFKSITVAGESLFKGLVTFVKGFVLGDREINAIATSEDDYNEDTKDSTLPTTGYVQKEIAALDDHFLIKDDPDAEQSVAGPVTFEQDVTVQGDHAVGKSQTIGGNQTINGTQEVKGVQTLHQGFKTPDFFQQGDIIQGAQVDAEGNAAFTSITTPVMQIYELQYNRKTAVQEEFIFSDGDTIETVTYIQADGTEIDSTVYNGEEYSYIRLGVRKQYEGYMTTFKDEDILYSNVNIIGESGKPATTGKCWMRVLALNNDLGVDPISSDGLFINALLYSTSQCPAGVNMAPTPHMIISRHGNAGIDEDGNAKYPERQSVFIISTASENKVMLRGISAPIIPQTGAYAIVSGKLPKSLFDKVHSYASYISKDDPVSYARYGIFENMIQLDHEGSPIKTERYRGVWSEDIAKGDEDNRYRSKYATDITYYDTVSYEGSKWACEDDKTTESPSDSSTKWTKIVSKGDDGTSIKVSGSYNTIDAFEAAWKNADGTWKSPKDESECYVVAGDLYVWVQNDAKWDNVGRFKGDKGNKGDSVTGSVTEYAINQSMTQRPDDTEFNETFPTNIEEGDVLWTRTRSTFDNSTISAPWTYTSSRQAKDGADGVDGGTINSITTEYKVTATYEQPDATADWPNTIEAALAELNLTEMPSGYYLWEKTIVDYSEKGETEGKKDTIGIKVTKSGENGTSVSAGTPEYQVSNNGTTVPTGTWSTDIPTVGEGQYLWTRTPFTEGTTTTYAYSVSKNGVNGESVTIEGFMYAVTDSNAEPADREFSPEVKDAGEGQYLWVMTIFSDGSKVKTYSYQGMDNSAVEYTLLSNVTTIYFHDENTLSTESINLVVRKATSKGVEMIDDTSQLDGFKLQYAYDGVTDDRIDLTLDPTTVLLEDGSEMLLEDGTSAEYEFTVEDIRDVKNYIQFYLVNTDTDEIWATCTVAVVRDGASTLSVELDTKLITVNIDAESSNLPVIDESKDYVVKVQVKIGGVAQLLSGYTLTNKSSADGTSNENTFAFSDADSYTKMITIPITKNMPSSFIPEWVEFKAVSVNNTSSVATDRVRIHKSQRGITGPMGNDGASYYPQGSWDANETYEVTKETINGKEVVTARPIVYHDPNDNGNGTYYVLEADRSLDEDPSDSAYNPSVWRPFQYFKYIFTEAMMAKWARLADAVFYGSYMFSARGVDANGASSSYTKDMFTNGVLNGNFTPSIFLDLLNGGAKFNKLYEPFIKYPYSASSAGYIMDASVGHHVSVGRRVSEDIYYPCVVFLPKVSESWDADGASCTIFVQAKANTSDRSEYDKWDSEDALTGIGNKIVMLCSDGMLASTGEESNVTFMVNGVQTKFIFLEHGGFVRLKSCKVDDDMIWIVENQTDFEQIRANITIKNEAVTIDGNNPEVDFACTAVDTFYPMSREVAYGSKYIRDVMDRDNATSSLVYNIVVTNDEDGNRFVHTCSFGGTN